MAIEGLVPCRSLLICCEFFDALLQDASVMNETEALIGITWMVLSYLWLRYFTDDQFACPIN